MHSAYDQKNENWREYLDQYNEVLRETEQNYIKEMEQLHQKQFDSLPEEKKYKGGRTVDELLQDMAEGKDLSDAELKNGFSDDFAKDLEGMGISRDDIEGMRVRIGGGGDVIVDGIEDETVREQVQKLIDEKYSNISLRKFYKQR